MRYIKTFENKSETNKFDLNFAITKIKEEFSDNDVSLRYDNEILEWTEDDWEDDYESEYDWYMEHNNGEAQDVVIEEMINWYKKTHDKDLSLDDESELSDEIKSEYGLE